jgi:uncharacterized protein (DUF58 family)
MTRGCWSCRGWHRATAGAGSWRRPRPGVWTLGPPGLGRGDRLGMVVRYRPPASAATARLIVRPVVRSLATPPSGRTWAEDDLAAVHTPAGTVTFDALREYVPGDDTRRIHWPSFARTGTLFVRSFVDPGGVCGAVVLETCREAYPVQGDLDLAARAGVTRIGPVATGGRRLGPTPGVPVTCPEFEDAVDATAALLVAFAGGNLPVRLCTDAEPAGPRRRDGAATVGELLDALAAVNLREPDRSAGSSRLGSLADVVDLAATPGVGSPVTSLIVVTGPRHTDAVRVAQTVAGRIDQVAVVALGHPRVRVETAGGVIIVALPSARELPGVWRELSGGVGAVG